MSALSHHARTRHVRFVHGATILALILALFALQRVTPALAAFTISQLVFDANTFPAGVIGQSFTAPSDGKITQIAVLPKTVVGDGSTTLRIYSGAGIGGAQLHSQPVTLAPAGEFVNLTLTTPVDVTGTGQYTFAFDSSDLRHSFSNLYADGAMINNGALNGAWDLAFIVTDADAPPVIVGTPPAGTYGTAYSFTFTSSTTPAPTFSVTAGELPPGLTLATNGELSGTPETTGTFGPVTISATNDRGTDTQAVTLVIDPAALTVTAKDQTKVYGDANPDLTASEDTVTAAGLIGDDTIANSLSGALETTALPTSEVGETFPITAGTLAASPNYDLTFVPGTLSITQRPLTVTAQDVTRRVNTPNPDPLPLLFENFANDDDVSDLDAAPTASTAATQGSAEGTYDIIPAGGADTNYSFVYVNGTLTVTAKAIPVIGWPDTLTPLTYGAPLGAARLNATATDSESGQPVAGTFSYSVGGSPVTAATVLNAGAGQIVTASFTPADTATYAEVSDTAQVDVARAPLTIKADDKAFLRGGAVPALTATYTGFVNGDTAASLDSPVQLTTTAQSNSNPGAYPITAGGAADANYTITFQNGVMTVRSTTPVLKSLNGTTGGPGSVVLFELEGFGPGETVTISVDGRSLLTVTADSLGAARFTLTFTGGARTYTVVATGSVDVVTTTAVRTASATVTISAGSPVLTLPPGTGTLPGAAVGPSKVFLPLVVKP